MKVSASCSRPYALRRPNLVCFPALDSINQNNHNIKIKLIECLKVLSVVEFLFFSLGTEFSDYIKSKKRRKDSKGYTTDRRYNII